MQREQCHCRRSAAQRGDRVALVEVISVFLQRLAARRLDQQCLHAIGVATEIFEILHEARSIAIEHEGQRYKVGLGREIVCIERGMLGPIAEIFVNAQKVNSPLDVLASDGAILMSMLLQYGCPSAEIAKSMKRTSDGSPASPLGRAAMFLVEEQP